MNKLFQAAGLLSVGAASISSLGTLKAVADETKPWGVSASVKAFYDDNINTSRGTTPKTDSVGLDVSPSIHLKTDLEGTKLGLDYDFGARYFENRGGDKFDLYHTLNATAARAFSNDSRVSLQDNFKISQEPEVLSGGAPIRTKGDNLRNLARGSFEYGFAPNLSAVLDYSNTYFNYDDKAYQGLLGRIEHLPGLTLRYKLAESTYTSLGYQYGVVDYDGKTAIDFLGHTSNVRDNSSHYVFRRCRPRLLARAEGFGPRRWPIRLV